jgi:RNA polymerase sigma factor (sigma-70 family)
MSATRPTDRELVAAAQAGDLSSLGLLLERHRAALYAACVRLLGRGAAAQDAVQDACVVALRRVPELRDPDAFSGWLHAIARNVCLMELRRSSREVLVDEPAGHGVPSLEEELERHALRAWVWAAIDSLSEPLRLAVVLRYFGRRRSYEEIAQLSGVPVGTVRSRLSAARSTLADAVLAAAATDDDADARARLWHEQLAYGFAEYNRGDCTTIADVLAPELVVRRGDGAIGGKRDLLPGLQRDADAGVRVRGGSVVAAAKLFVLDAELENPPDDPFHCPPAFTWVAFNDGRTISRLHFHHPPRAVA